MERQTHPSDPAHPLTATPRWRRRKDARPGEIVQAALETFVERGFAAARLEEVARRAGVTRGTMYLYFPSKQALFEAVVRRSVIPGIERAEQLAEEFEGGSADLLDRLVRDWWERVGNSPTIGGLPKLVMAEAANFPDIARFYHEQVVRRSQAVLQRAVRRGIARGEFRADVEPEIIARLAVAPLLLFIQWKHSIGPVIGECIDGAAMIDTHLRLLRRALEHPDQGGRP
jgi:AcrR family transcriptional regulator